MGSEGFASLPARASIPRESGSRPAGLAAPLLDHEALVGVRTALQIPRRDREPRAPLKPARKEPVFRGLGAVGELRGSGSSWLSAGQAGSRARGVRPSRTELPAVPNLFPTGARA